MRTERDDRTRTPPHGDPLRPWEKANFRPPADELVTGDDCRIQGTDTADAAPPPSDAVPQPNNVTRVADGVVGARTNQAYADGWSDAMKIARPPSDAALGAATARAMAGPEIPHNEAGVPIIIPGVATKDVDAAAAVLLGWVGEEAEPDWEKAGEDARGRYRNAVRMVLACVQEDSSPPSGHVLDHHRLPSHIERAARKAYRAGYGDRSALDSLDDQRGVDAFRESLQRDADEAALTAQKEG